MTGKEKEIARFQEESASGDFWLDQERAQKVMRDLMQLREQVELWRGLEKQASDLVDLAELAQAEGDTALNQEVGEEASALARRLDQLEFQLMLGGEHDRKNAILAIHAGAGGTESQDWAQMLLRMYLRWAERRGYSGNVLDTTWGEEAGIKSTTVEIIGPYAYGYLTAERGVHRLVRLSPFDAAHRRHTSFALVEVMPEVEQEVEVAVNPDDLEIDVFRSSGAGGQNVQKTSTAVRITHRPTGIVVTCQNERSQLQNKETALKILRARLLEIELERKEEEILRLKGQHVAAGWGNQIRSYVLHPYNMVKDHRSGYETSDTAAVLDGEIDGFIEAYLRMAR
ncbi:MAG: peptide chain release factor 2 [Chloroflexi bacterium]|nr:peptide chain release factor 2 [Chloroflexota bacterium]